MKTEKEWATLTLKAIFRKDHEMLIRQIQDDARKDLLYEIDGLIEEIKSLERNNA